MSRDATYTLDHESGCCRLDLEAVLIGIVHHKGEMAMQYQQRHCTRAYEDVKTNDILFYRSLAG